MHLTQTKIKQLTRQGCAADSWKSVQVAKGCDLSRLQNVTFHGSVALGPNSGTHELNGVRVPCGIYNATLSDSEVGAGVRIANVHSMIARYRIEEGALIQDVGLLVSELGTTFGNGLEVDVVNEGGGRGTKIFNRVTAQVAYLKAMLRHNPSFTQQLRKLADAEIARTTPDRGVVGRGARIIGCGSLRNVVVGPFARVEGAALLENGTINSCEEHPTVVGTGVQAKEFVISEGARVETGAIIDKVFVGQGVKMGKQYSAESSLFFANCEAFHGEAVSLFAGPYTVTHHKSTLLIAGLFSFYNAGSGTNQSNHMYKLGPVHQGVLERGCKTGSFSYLLFESHVGAFSVVIGKHLTNVNTPHLPFSYIHEKGGESMIIPGMNLFAVGTVRDGEKWPKRDNRKAKEKRDLIIFDVFSPYTVEKMRRGRHELVALNESTSKERATVLIGGIQMSRVLLRKGSRSYDAAVKRYIYEKVTTRLAEALSKDHSWENAVRSLAPASSLQRAADWTDLCGLLAPMEMVRALESDVSSGTISSYDRLLAALQTLYDNYRAYEWQYVVETFQQEAGYPLQSITREQAAVLVEEWQKAAVSIHASILDDSKKEFGHFARIGFGVDLPEAESEADFQAVRGSLDTNAVVQKLTKEGDVISKRATDMHAMIAAAV